jgi:hypothetical protein
MYTHHPPHRPRARTSHWPSVARGSSARTSQQRHSHWQGKPRRRRRRRRSCDRNHAWFQHAPQARTWNTGPLREARLECFVCGARGRNRQWRLHLQCRQDFARHSHLRRAETVVVERRPPISELEDVVYGGIRALKEFRHANGAVGRADTSLLVSFLQVDFVSSEPMRVERLQQPCHLRRYQHWPHSNCSTSC